MQVHPEVVVRLMQANGVTLAAKVGCSQNLWDLLKGKPILAELMHPIDKSSGDVIVQRARSLQHVDRGQDFVDL